MGDGRKRHRREGSEVPLVMHPRNRYAAAVQDFAALASLYPFFAPIVTVFVAGRPSVDFAAMRELTRVLLLYDHSLN